MEQKIAIYMRSSMEQDEDLRNTKNPDESDTIANQRKYLRENALLRGFADSQIVEYVDDGHTGTNFRRPAFEQMIADIKTGNIQIVMVKDFSRLGRDYIGVGEYVEQFFPVHGVRIISVNDNWDSNDHAGETLELDASFRTILYEMYSRDLSVKRKSANRVRNKNGVFAAGFVPYGYKKIPGDPHSIVVYEEHACVVRRIFELYNSGEKIGNIAKILTNEGIPKPSQSDKGRKNYSKIMKEKSAWTQTSIRKILSNEMYTGTLVLNRFEKRSFRARSCSETDPSVWMKFPDNHEAIISREVFETAKKRRQKKRKSSPIGEKRSYPYYCGHCGGKMQLTTRNERTFNCKHGVRVPADACGQIEIRSDVLEKILVDEINAHAKELRNKANVLTSVNNDLRKLESMIDDLSAEQQAYRDERIVLYEQYKVGRLDKTSFLEKKTAVLKKEEECLSELDSVKARRDMIIRERELAEKKADGISEGALIKTFDQEVVNSLISRIEFFNDGRIKIYWNYSAVTESNLTDLGVDERRGTVAIYTSDMFLMPQEDGDEHSVREHLTDYATRELDTSDSDVLYYTDTREIESLYFREGYMRFIDAGRTGRVDTLLIRSFKDLYLSNQQMNDLMFWILPKLPCKLISVEDGFDSSVAAADECRAMYEKYKGVRKGDITRHRALERKNGRREAKEVLYCSRLYGYYPNDDGCYADPEVLGIVKKMFQIAKESHNLKPVVKWLNDNNIPTSKAFYIQHGYAYSKEVNPHWDKDKLWGVMKQEGYVKPCRHYAKCMELGRHCDRVPIIDQETFDEVYRYCKYRNRSKK